MTPEASLPSPKPPGKRLRPRDAASLLLVDRSGGTPRILMGRRHAGLVFMPGKFVFPGGRTDAADGGMTAMNELNAADTQKLLAGMGSRATARRARALGLCAIRETFEETGLRVAEPARPCAAPPALPGHADWREFSAGGFLPALAKLRYFARAITPPDYVRRFDTRFFMIFCDQLPEFDKQRIVPSGELENLGWMALDEAGTLDLARITRAILQEARQLLAQTRLELPDSLPVVQHSMRHGRFVREVI